MPKDKLAFTPMPNQDTKGGDGVNSEQIKQLEKELWDAADNLRANSKLTAAEYKDPVLGLILLRYAQNRYEDAKLAIEPKLTGPRGKRPERKQTIWRRVP